ncbi:MAG: complex I subunit 5 family protein [Clostridiales bacterium]|nr:complex I subunit 5 family protein [Clostridiales bacterium]
MDVLLLFLIIYPIVGALLMWCLRRRVAAALMADFFAATECIVAAVLFVIYAPTVGNGTALAVDIDGVCGLGMHFVMDGFRLLYVLIAAFMWMMSTILSRQYMKGHPHTERFYLFMLFTLGMTMGVFLAADLYTMFIFFEGMSFTSYVWVAQEETYDALRAAGTYLAIAVIGGLVMLMGLFGLYNMLGTLTISELPAAAASYANTPLLYAMGACLLFGFGAKAGAFPLHIWLPKAHPVAPAPASALLSGMLTKAGVLGILITSSGLFYGDEAWAKLILAIGACTMFGGALLAVFSVDLKRTLACSSMSQIGFILIGIGMQGMLGEENALAVYGTILHMANHSMIKLVLFLAAGVIYMNTHALNLNEIRGFGRKKPLLKVIFLVGALAIGGIPFFGGYISKTLLHESILEYGGGAAFTALEYLFLFSGGMTVAYMTKLFVAIFVERNADEEKQRSFDENKHYMAPDTAFALTGSAVVLLVWGLFPHSIMNRAAELAQGMMRLGEFGEKVSYFSLKNLSGAAISIAIGAVVYLFIRKALMAGEPVKEADAASAKVYVNRWPKWLDLENLIYRPVLLTVLPTLCGIVCRFLDSLVDWVVVALRRTIYRDSPIPHEREEGTVFTEICGRILNLVQRIANRTWRRSNPTAIDYPHVLAVRRQVRRENTELIGRSLSFGLMMAGVGLCLTMLYILWM